MLIAPFLLYLFITNCNQHKYFRNSTHGCFCWNLTRKFSDFRNICGLIFFFRCTSSGKLDISETADSLGTIAGDSLDMKTIEYSLASGHEGAIILLVVFKRKTQFQRTSFFPMFFFRVRHQNKFLGKKKVQVVKIFYFFSPPLLSDRNNMGLPCAPFIKNFNIAKNLIKLRCPQWTEILLREEGKSSVVK